MWTYFMAVATLTLGMIGQAGLAAEEKVASPSYLYKVISPQEWTASQKQGYVVNSPLDTAFIHLAQDDQVKHVVQKFWSQKEYVVIKLATNRLRGRLVYEVNPGGSTKYYHLYDGSIPLTAVVEVLQPTS